MPDTTHVFFDSFCKVLFLIGIGDFWGIKESERDWPSRYVKLHRFVIKSVDVMLFLMIALEFSGIFVTDLNEADRLGGFMFTMSHTILWSYLLVVTYNEEGIKKLVNQQCVKLPRLYCNEAMEKQMIKRIKLYTATIGLAINTTVLFYGVSGFIRMKNNGGVFTVLVTYWPLKDDHSVLANAIRFFLYITLYLFMSKVTGVFALVLSQTMCLECRFKSLQHFFVGLDDIFYEDISQEEKELKFEEKFAFGIRMHAEIIWCVEQAQEYLGYMYSGQAVINTAVLALIVAQSLSQERTPVNLFTLFTSVVSVLLATGIFMWSAGDVTVEASILPDCMFQSGWQHCTRSAKRIESLLITGICQGQVPVVLKACGVIPMSYSSYVSIIRSTYSAFTVFF